MIAKTYVIHLDDDMPTDGNAIMVSSDPGKGWIWLVLWVLLAIGAPASTAQRTLVLGPIVSSLLVDYADF